MIIINDMDGDILYHTLTEFFSEDTVYEFKIEKDALFYKNNEMKQIAEMNNYLGTYTFTLTDEDKTQSKYTFVYSNQYTDPFDIEMMELVPIKLQDNKLFKYIDTGTFDFYEDDEIILTVDYTPYYEVLNKMEDNQLLTFNGEITTIQDYHNYVRNHLLEKNFQITEQVEEAQDLIEEILEPKSELGENDITSMENDNYMGKIKITYVNNIGMHLVEWYDILESTDDYIKYISCNIPTPSPKLLLSISEDEHFVPVRCCIPISYEYIPYSELPHTDDICEGYTWKQLEND